MIPLLFAKRGVIHFTPLLLLSVCGLLVSCSSMPQTKSSQPDNWKQTAESLAGIQQWRLTARLAVQTDTQGGSVDVFWTQKNNTFDIRMVAPMGQGAMQLRGDARWVQAKLANGESLAGKPDELLQRYFSVRVPVAGLVYWLRGLAAPGADYRDASWNEQQRLHSLQQFGWRVEMLKYRAYGDVLLPHKFYLEPVEPGETAVRIIIRQWVLDQAAMPA